MKKVRLAIGAVGAVGAVPALGLMMPAGNAAAAATHTPAKTGKTVVLQDRNAPDSICTDALKGSAFANGMYGGFFYSGDVVCGQSASVAVEKTGLAERVRFWERGDLLRTIYVTPGTFESGRTVFWSSTPHSGSEVCQAIVKEATLAVEYGPVCE
jgi:hypothetical protein